MVYIEGGPIWLYYLARLIELAVIVLLTIVWCNSMERALSACDPSSRKMQRGQTWLIFVPLFGFVWQFVAVNRVSISLATEYHLRGWKSDEGRPGIETGLIACVVVVVVFLLRAFLVINPGLAVLMSLAVCICMYMHRERLNAFTERLEVEKRKAQQSFSFDSGPNPFFQQPFVPQPFGNYNSVPNYNTPYSQQGYPPYTTPPVQQNDPVNNPFQPKQHVPPADQYMQQQFVKQAADEYQQQKKKDQELPAGGWDGVTVWEAPEGWQHPDLSDPKAYFS